MPRGFIGQIGGDGPGFYQHGQIFFIHFQDSIHAYCADNNPALDGDAATG
jgi:hypothetical protein